MIIIVLFPSRNTWKFQKRNVGKIRVSSLCLLYDNNGCCPRGCFRVTDPWRSSSTWSASSRTPSTPSLAWQPNETVMKQSWYCHQSLIMIRNHFFRHIFLPLKTMTLPSLLYSQCSFSVLLRWVNAIKVWANAIKIQDQHKKIRKHCLGNWQF